MYVSFQMPISERDRPPERLNRIFVAYRRAATVRESQWTSKTIGAY